MSPMWADVVYAGLCLQSRWSWSRSAKTTQAGLFLLHAWWSPAHTQCPHVTLTHPAQCAHQWQQQQRRATKNLHYLLPMWADVVFLVTVCKPPLKMTRFLCLKH